MIYNKLVRDNIPELIESDGYHAITRTLESDEYKNELEIKLDEECKEFHESKELDELADILEVIYALSEAYGYSREQLMEAYQKKHDKRGGFSKRIFLMSKMK